MADADRRSMPAELEPVVADLLSAEGWAHASALPVEAGDPGRFHALSDVIR